MMWTNRGLRHDLSGSLRSKEKADVSLRTKL
jgi:hypothetical protein